MKNVSLIPWTIMTHFWADWVI